MTAPTAPATPRVRVRRVPIEGRYARVTMVQAEDTQPPAFVLVPGFSMAATYFELLAPALAALGTVAAVELPGVGGVPGPDGGLTVDASAADLAAVVAALGAQDAVLVGHSMGSQIVVEAHRAHAVGRALVLVAPIVRPERRSLSRTLIAFARSGLREPARVVGIAALSYLLTGPRALGRALPSVIAYRLEARLPAVRVPIRLIRGSEDRLSTISWLRAAAAAHDDVQIHVVPGAAHSVVHAHADDVADACAAVSGRGASPRRVDHLADAPMPFSAAARLRLAEFRALRAQDDASLQRLKQQKLDDVSTDVLRARAPRTN